MHIRFTSTTLSLDWPDGGEQSLASEWLLDNAPEHRDPGSGQRLIDIADLPAQPRIRAVSLEGDWVRIEWEGALPTTRLRIDWLRGLRTRSSAHSPPARCLWAEGAMLDLRRDFAVAPLDVLERDARQRLAWLERLLSQGLALIEAVPTADVPTADAVPTADGVPTEDCGLLRAMRAVGRVQETNYGLVFEVRSVPQPENLAYSDLGLGLHTDNPYREPVPGFQALHALVVSPDGGDSLFADGWALAERLRREDPDAFAQLATTAVPFHYRSKDAELQARRPLIQLACAGQVEAVHYNSRSIAPLDLELEETPRFYAAYRRFAERLRDPRVCMRHRLAAGDTVVFDNRRILHGRTAFSSQRHPRHLRGCYLTRDSVYGTAALLARTLAEAA